MNDFSMNTLEETGAVVAELAANAREARTHGRSRRDFFATTAKLAGATALGAAGIELIQPIAAAAATTPPVTESFQDILNIAATAEALASTFYYVSLQEPTNLPNVNSDANRNYFQAATVQEYVHLQILQQLGGKPLATKFFFPSKMFTDESTFFATASLLEDYFISAYIAAAKEFSGVGSSGIAKPFPVGIGLAVQIAGVECEHRALLRVASSSNPPNNRIIESALVGSVSAAVPPLTPFLTGGGNYTVQHQLPSKASIDARSSPYGFASFPAYTIA